MTIAARLKARLYQHIAHKQTTNYLYGGIKMQRKMLACVLTMAMILSFLPANIEALVVPVASTVSLWKAEGNANDSIGTAHGTMQNGATFAAGKVGQAFSFDGVDDYVEIPKVAKWDFGTSSFSVSAWFKSNTPGFRNIVRYHDGGLATGMWGVRFNPTGQIQFLAGHSTITTDHVYADGNWHFVTAVRDSVYGKLKIYINGNPAAANVSDGGATIGGTNHRLAIGAGLWGGGGPFEPFAGFIDEVAVYNRALTAAEIAAIYNSTGNTVNIAAIGGVAAPVTGATAATSITPTAQYTGIVSWSPALAAGGTFAPGTAYTATITLAAKPGFTFTGVPANFFTVAGAVYSSPADSGVVTAVFPVTVPAPDTVINIAAIQGVTAPIAGATPVTAITETAQYTGTVTWSPAHATFAPGTTYTATITLTPKSGFTFTGVTENFFTVAGAIATNVAGAGIITAVFPATATQVGGVISSNTTWTAAASPYHVTSSVTVAAGVTLTVEAGVVVKFAQNTGLEVHGTLNVPGTVASKVYFTDFRDDTVGGDINGDGAATVPVAGWWNGIDIRNNGSANLNHTVIRYGGANVVWNWAWGRHFGNLFKAGAGSLTLTNSVLSHSASHALRLLDTAVVHTVYGNTFEQNATHGILLENAGSAVTISNNIVRNNQNNGIHIDNSSPAVTGNTSTGNTIYGIYMSSNSRPAISGNTLSGNTRAPLGVAGGNITADTVWDADVAYYIEGSVNVPAGRTLTVPAGAVVKFAQNTGLGVDGTLNVPGTVTNKVYFTDFRDDTVGGDINGDGAATVPAAGWWNGIDIRNNGSANLNHTVIRYGGANVVWNWAWGRHFGNLFKAGAGSLTLTNSVLSHSASHALRLRDTAVVHTVYGNTFEQNATHGILLENASGVVTISNNIVRNNQNNGIHIDNSSPVIGGTAGQGNDIFGNTNFGVQNITPSIMVNAKYNYWGAPTGPRHTSNPSGTGDRVSDHVDFTNFLGFSITGGVTIVINFRAIPGVTVPVAGATPVTAITETAQYTGTVTWSPALVNGRFAHSTAYTATITLTAKSSFTLTGVAANFFTVAGATATNTAGSGVVTAVFPATAPAPDTVISIATIPGVTTPVAGATPVTTITETAQYTGTVTWSPALVNGKFAHGTAYTATIMLAPKTGFTLTGVSANFFTVAGAVYSNPVNSGVITAVFPATAAATVPVTGVTVTPAAATINVGATQQLIATVAPANATNKSVTWSSSAPAVATVSDTGLVKGVAAGNVTITVTTADGNRTATSAITVVVPVTGVTITPASATINIGDTRQLTAAVSPADATNKAATWSSNAPAVATVSPTGLVSGVSAGTAVITVNTVDGNRTATSTITVVAPAQPAPAPVPPPPPVVEWPVIVGQITIGEIEDVVEINVPAGAIIGESPKIIPQVLSETAVAPLIAAAAEVGLTAASKVLELTLTGGEFRNKVQLELDFDAARVPRGQVPSVFAYNERTDRWIYLGGQVGEGVVTVTVDRFHKTAVFAANPLPPLVDTAGHWGRSSITTLAGMGIVSGFPDGRFIPNAGVTRAEFVSMLTRALNLRAKPEAAARFTDAVGWAQGAIGAAVEAGLVKGFPDGSFAPARQITRDELAAILARVIERRLVLVGNAEEIMFADAAAIPAWARDAVRSAITAGLVRGFPDRTFRPGATTTRAESTAMLYRLVAER
jgi:parallel beta-helix repeat protein